MDRNFFDFLCIVDNLPVALLAEGVDRNQEWKKDGKSVKTVALLAEGVDRNIRSGDFVVWGNESPSSRRAWIEIPLYRVVL